MLADGGTKEICSGRRVWLYQSHPALAMVDQRSAAQQQSIISAWFEVSEEMIWLLPCRFHHWRSILIILGPAGWYEGDMFKHHCCPTCMLAAGSHYDRSGFVRVCMIFSHR